MIFNLKRWTTVMLIMAITFLQGLQTVHAAPTITSFSIPSTSSTLLIPVSLTASGATGYLVNETSTKPLLSNSKWTSTPPTSYLVYTSGSRVVYAWVRDAAGVISPSVSRTVNITLPTTSSALCSGAAEYSTMNFSCPSGKVVTSVSFASYGTPSGSCGSFQVGSCHASNSSQIVSSACMGKASCSVQASNSYFGDPCSGINKRLSAQFVCGDAPVVSSSLPTVTSFSIPSTSSTLLIPVSLSVSGPVTHYIVNETSTKPSLTHYMWTATKPTSYNVYTSGSRVIYAWVKDAAGNISAPVSRTVNITLSSTTPTTPTTPTVPTTPTTPVQDPTPTTPTTTSSTNTVTTADPVPTATYYVSTSGSDSASGSSTSPFRTLANACTRVTAAGSLILVRAGTYNETARCNLSVGVSIAGEGISSTIIRTSYRASSSSDGAIRLNSSSHTNGNQVIKNLTFDGSNLTALRGIVINYRNNVSIHHVKVANFYASAIFFRGSTGAWDVMPPVFASGNNIHDSIIDNSATRASGESASIRINGQSNFLLYNNNFTQTFRTAGLNGNILGGEWNKNLKIHHNNFTKSDYEGSAWNFFYELWHWEGGGEIYANNFLGAATMDIVDVKRNSSTYGLKIYDNKFFVKSPVGWTAHATQGINIELRTSAEDIFIYNNHFKNVNNGIWVDGYVYTQEGYTSILMRNIHIYKNLLENVGSLNGGGSAILLNGFGGNGNQTWDNIQVYSNTITAGTTTTWGDGIEWHAGGKNSNSAIRNNIIQGFRSRPIQFEIGITGATMSNITVENNLYYQNATNSANYQIPITNRIDRNNITANPLFYSPSTGVYAPASNSPACTASTTGSYIGAFPCR